MAELTVIWWRDIPAQVTASRGRERARVQLSDRFQEAVDASAMVAGLIGSDEYMGEWHKEKRPCGEELEGEAKSEAERLELAFSDDVLAGLAVTGWKPE